MQFSVVYCWFGALGLISGVRLRVVRLATICLSTAYIRVASEHFADGETQNTTTTEACFLVTEETKRISSGSGQTVEDGRDHAELDSQKRTPAAALRIEGKWALILRVP